MIGNYKEKYLLINRDFASLSGKIDQTVQAQKRLVKRLSKERNLSSDMKELLVSVAISIEDNEAFLVMVNKFLKGVIEDSNALLEGADLRNKIKWQGELINDFIDVTGRTSQGTVKQ